VHRFRCTASKWDTHIAFLFRKAWVRKRVRSLFMTQKEEVWRVGPLWCGSALLTMRTHTTTDPHHKSNSCVVPPSPRETLKVVVISSLFSCFSQSSAPYARYAL